MNIKARNNYVLCIYSNLYKSQIQSFSFNL